MEEEELIIISMETSKLILDVQEMKNEVAYLALELEELYDMYERVKRKMVKIHGLAETLRTCVMVNYSSLDETMQMRRDISNLYSEIDILKIKVKKTIKFLKSSKGNSQKVQTLSDILTDYRSNLT